MLEQWYNLSDPQMEEALNDRMAFRRFVGLGFQKDAPDYSTISRFRTALGEELSGQLFAELERQLEEQGMVLKRGTLMDATLVQAQVRRPPLDKGRGAKSPNDPDRANKHQPVLSHWQQRRNELISPIRSKVEKVFGTLKRSYGYQRVRYRGTKRNA